MDGNGVARDMEIYLDADGCPVKDETYKVAKRYGLVVHVVANASLRVPADPLFRMVVVRHGLDAADNWIAERVTAEDVAITSDIPLAERCLARGAWVLSHRGDPFTEDMIGEAMATRALMDMLRQDGSVFGGPSPFSPKDRSRFLSGLDQAIQMSLRRKR